MRNILNGRVYLWCRTLSTYIVLAGLATAAYADGVDDGSAETEVTIEYFDAGESKTTIGNTGTNTSGVLIEAEYEKDHVTYTVGYERWNYTWTNPEDLPFVSGTTAEPWTTFDTIQLGIDFEQEINDQWEFTYYLEAESSFEKEMSSSFEYEAGVDFNYEASKSWSYTLNVNLEYLDADGAELGMDLEIEWNHDSKEGWSGEFEISSEFPETHLTYHYTEAFSTTFFYNESGTNTIRLSDTSPVIGMQGGYLEDEYNSIGVQFGYELIHGGTFSFIVQQNMNRQFSFSDKTEREVIYTLGDAMEIAIGFDYEF